MNPDPPRPCVFYHKIHGVFSSPNAEDLPVFPVPRMGQFLDPLVALRTIWADNRYVFLALVPLYPRLDTPPFDVIRSYTVIQHSHGGWGLTAESAKRWSRLESMLIDVAKIIFDNRELYLPLEALYPIPPNKFGYGVTHNSEKGAKLALHKSRAAFFLLMAYISFLLMGASESEADCSTWLHKTLIKAGLSYDDVKAIIESEMVDFSPSYRRAGLIVDHTCKFNYYIRTFIMRKVPVWFYWGNHISRHTIELFNQYMPKEHELSTARWCEIHRGPRRRQVESKPIWVNMSSEPTIPTMDPLPLDEVSDYTASRSPSPSCSLPLPTPGNGQIEGETWHDYFARREKIREYLIARETPSERQKRIQVEAARADYAIPGRKGPLVYRWRRNKHGFWLRTPVTRNEVPERWEEFTNTQKKFDSNLNQWDLCKELDPVSPEDEDDQELYDEYMGVNPQSPQAASLPLPSISPEPVTNPLPTQDDDWELHDEYMKVDPQPPQAASLPLPSMPPGPVIVTSSLMQRTSAQSDELEEGELPHLSAPPSPIPHTLISSLPSSWDSPASWGEEDTFELLPFSPDDDDDPHNLDGVKSYYENSLLSILSHRFGFLTPISPLPPIPDVLDWSLVKKIIGDTNAVVGRELTAPISVFVSNRVAKLAVPEQLCDLSLASPEPFVDHMDSSLLLIKSTANGVPQYMLVPRGSDPPRWLLGLDDPLTLLQCFRLEIGPSTSNLVSYLFSNGIPFHTYIPASKLPHIYPKYPPVTLGFRPANHRPRISEYAVYENARHSLLSRPYGRAALLQGGIVWRLALNDFEHKEDANYSVICGPSDYVTVYPHVLCTDGGQRFYDDGLDDTELDLICGVYKVATGNGNQTSDLSWWPKQSVFMRSGLWLGYWSPDCESWFQGRLKDIRERRADLKTSSKWNSALKYYVKSTSKFVKTNQNIATEYLCTAAANILT